jgi:hypothetical protein
MAEMREMHLQILGYRKAWLRRRALFCRLRGCYLRHRLRRRGGIHVMATACPSSARLSGPNGPHNPRRLCPGRKPNPAGTSVGTTLIGTAIVSVGSWSLDTNLAAGSYSSLNVVATDLAGNSTTAINAQTIIVDQTNPTVSSVTTSEIGIDASGNGDLNASSTYWSTGLMCGFSRTRLLQYGHRCDGGRRMRSTMAWRIAGRLG